MAIPVVFYAEQGESPVIAWLAEQTDKVRAKIRTRIVDLQESGHMLRRPASAPLRDGIHELRVRHQNVNYRVLYFFQGRIAAVLTHGCTKEAEVDAADIERAIRRKAKFIANPSSHTLTDVE